MLSIPALILTAAWAVVVAILLVLFGRTAGGGWSIAEGVARGIRDWAARAADGPARPSSPSPSSAHGRRTEGSPAAQADPGPEIEEL